MLISHRLGFLAKKDFEAIENALDDIGRMLNRALEPFEKKAIKRFTIHDLRFTIHDMEHDPKLIHAFGRSRRARA
jgi:hypothetical protein